MVSSASDSGRGDSLAKAGVAGTVFVFWTGVAADQDLNLEMSGVNPELEAAGAMEIRRDAKGVLRTGLCEKLR
jgi:hypothetical protein